MTRHSLCRPARWALMAALALPAVPALAQQQDGALYGGALLGGGRGASGDFRQIGTAFRDAGILHVNAGGRADSDAALLLGGQIGYWLPASGSPLRLAVELEGLYLDHERKAALLNPTNQVPDHRFVDQLPLDIGVLLANAVFSFGGGGLQPYVGLGVGGAILAASGADSAQVNPAEPGINHFNSDDSASSAALAFQVKAGLRYQLGERLSLVTEYRHLRLSDTDYDFGPTVYPGHAPTSPWQVKLDTLKFNMAVAGLQYRF